MVHRVVWRLSAEGALDFWQERLTQHGYEAVLADGSLRFDDFEGLGHELTVVHTTDEPLIAHHPEIPPELALQGFHAVRAYTDDSHRSRPLLETTLGFAPEGAQADTGFAPDEPQTTMLGSERTAADEPQTTMLGSPQGGHTAPASRTQGHAAWEVRGEHRGGYYFYDPAPPERPLQGAGSVHHVAWAAHPEDEAGWQERVAAAGAHPTPIIDRHYFHSVYFREPSGVLFEIATIGPGFTVDEPLEHLGEKLSLTPQFEHLRDQIEPTLTPLRNPRESWARR
jgi:glyoxalase family protein